MLGITQSLAIITQPGGPETESLSAHQAHIIHPYIGLSSKSLILSTELMPKLQGQILFHM